MTPLYHDPSLPALFFLGLISVSFCFKKNKKKEPAAELVVDWHETAGAWEELVRAMQTAGACLCVCPFFVAVFVLRVHSCTPHLTLFFLFFGQHPNELAEPTHHLILEITLWIEVRSCPLFCLFRSVQQSRQGGISVCCNSCNFFLR